ncbi:crotonase/enoyl-CoA hydratase family protein [Pseudoalteromonas xiamenensis]|uniref:crotonase/enoyl-CoA hydratase family protein n=1 Tax=Pseudoalteromonas xiamenensis TaxID=882626 RepID=UPI0035EFA158
MVKLEIKEQVAWITLSRPEKQNALSFEMFQQLASTIKQIRKDKSLRAAVITGDGNHFSSGLDVKSVVKSPSKIVQLLFKWLPGNQNLVQKVVLGWHSLPIPTFALIHGNCFGGGLQIALGCDFRLAAPSSQFAIMEARWGLCPDMGATIHLPAQMNYDDALWLSMTADPIAVETAKQQGLITQVCDDPRQRCLEMLDLLKSRSPDALAGIKSLCQRAYHNRERTILAKETATQLGLLLAKNTKIVMKNVKSDSPIYFLPRK